ncbi:TSUP family transporter [Tropicimonas sp. TH_r6]|uniref:TSUP family transporter n=1 Tax=Tropicimonas sp. TH_r6 TaxID=3082085 RepID=UPI002955BC6C|nr:TSUP family transporter [Tropicimonas sp. TH_r6]MDV7144572.1 TSUP family transporter [Tropicimonas sp. TH_r6]
MFEVAPELVALLAMAAFAAGFVDSIAGGGGLIALPIMLMAGASPVEALSTNKLQGAFGAATAAISYGRAGHVDLWSQRWPAVVAFLASICGALLITNLPTDGVRAFLPWLLIAIAAFFALRPGLSDLDRAPRLGATAFALTAVPAIAFYDGLLGPGTGSFFMLAFVLLAGQGILKATAHTKLLNLASNLGALLLFAFAGHIWWATGLVMAVAQIGGARLGAHMAMRKGARLIKPLLVVVSLTLALRLLTSS